MTDYKKREWLQRQPTRYEAIVERGDQKLLLGYSMRTGRHALLDMAQKHGQTLIAIMGLDDNARMFFLKPASAGAKIGDWSIRFTGRTQREAIGSELPFVGSLEVSHAGN